MKRKRQIEKQIKKWMAVLLSTAMVIGSAPQATFAATDAEERLSVVEEIETTDGMFGKSKASPEKREGDAESTEALTEINAKSSEGEEELEKIRLGETVHIVSNDRIVQKFLFTPEEDGIYTFFSSNARNCDPCGSIYDEDIENLLENNDNIEESDKNFKITIKMEGGRSYWILAEFYDYGDLFVSSYDLTVEREKSFTLDGNGGSCWVGRKLLVEIEKGKSLNDYSEDWLEETFYRKGAILRGWSTSPEGEVITELYEEFPEDGQTYYAIWKMAEEIALLETKHLDFQGPPRRYGYYLFTAPADGIYSIRSMNNTGHPMAALYEEDFSEYIFDFGMIDSDKEEGEKNFAVIQYLKSGESLGIAVYDLEYGSFDLIVENTATVTLDGNGGTAYSDKTVITEYLPKGGSLLSVVGDWKPFKKEFCTFVGWSNRPDGEPFPDIKDIYPENGETYYAVWRETPQISCGETVHVGMDTEWIPAFLFMPDEDGKYLISFSNISTSSFDVDTYDEHLNDWIASAWREYEEDSTRILYELKGGITYRISISSYISDSFAYDLTVVREPTPLPEVKSIELNATSLTMKPGEKFKLSASVLPEGAANPEVKWKSGATKVVKVSKTGRLTAVAAGTATIRAMTANGVKAFCKVTVKPTEVTEVILNKTSASLTVGLTEQLSADAYPEDADDTSITWDSSNTEVATVSQSGLVKAVRSGTCTITASAENGVEASCKITVKQIYVYQLEKSGVYRYTTSTKLVKQLRNQGWSYKKVFRAAGQSGNPVYWIYYKATKRYRHTTDKALAVAAKKAGNNAGVAFYGSEKTSVPVYELCKDGKTYVYTTSKATVKSMKNTGWKYKGVAWYAEPKPLT